MDGTIAPTDYDWFAFLLSQGPLEEVNFWRPSAARRFRAEPFSPFLFKLKAPHNAICGFGYFARYSALPIWLAWETFGVANGCLSQSAMLGRVEAIRERMNFRGKAPVDHIGCILIVSPIFFSPGHWIPQPPDWPARSLGPTRYDLQTGTGAHVWQACLERAGAIQGTAAAPGGLRYGAPQIVQPRLGQGTFRISVTDAYQRACAVTNEHSLPALEAAHIRPYAEAGPHEISNGLLLRADFHRLFDQGYVTVTSDLRLEVSRRLREDYANGKTYYPFHGSRITVPSEDAARPRAELLAWHNSKVFRG